MRVFVYGTLKPGEANYPRYCAGKVAMAIPAIARGQLFALPFGYPAMMHGDDWIYGYLLNFQNPAVLITLDLLEDYQPDRPAHKNEYERVQIPVFDRKRQPQGLAWAYLMQPDRIHRCQGTLIPGGNWSSQ
ncbi:MAG: gamma-glutamylcyclotransferase [Cyanothece sp. SIO1E1]|nr:gamma-glutamylcyclotransferase [Cyanothece sp. SIO1E1]